MPWSRKLTKPIALDDGRVFETLRDAADYALALPDIRKAHLSWQYAIELMMAAAKPRASRTLLERAERQLDICLRADGVLGLKRSGAKEPRPRRP